MPENNGIVDINVVPLTKRQMRGLNGRWAGPKCVNKTKLNIDHAISPKSTIMDMLSSMAHDPISTYRCTVYHINGNFLKIYN